MEKTTGTQPYDASVLDRLSLRIYGLGTRAVHLFTGLAAWAQVALVYGASRVFGWALFSVVGLHQTYGPWKNGAMTYSEFVMIWDADWYRKIAETGYPSVLPLDGSGRVAQNEWAFYPLYPLFNRGLMELTGLDYAVVAPTVSLLAGFGAAWFIYRLFTAALTRQLLALPARWQGQDIHNLALWGTAAVAFCPVAPILQTGYAEALGLFFLAWALTLLVERRYIALLIPALAAALTRPVGVPLGATVGIWWFLTLLAHVRDGSTLLAALRVTAVQLASALAVCAFAFLHPAHAWADTGRMDAYTATETAWRAGGEHVSPFVPWLTQATLYLGVAGPAVLVVLLLVYTLVMVSPPVRRVLPGPLLTWCWAYTVYMLAFFNPQSSTFRLLLPLFPLLLPLVALSASNAYRWLLIVSGAALKFGWVGWLWHWKQLPGGGDYPP